MRRPARLLALLLTLVAGCAESTSGPGAQAGTPSASVRDVAETPAGNRWWVRTRPAPDDRALELMVHENACASGQPATERIHADVAYERERIVVTVAVEYAGGDQTCPGNPDTPFTLELDEPVGDREIYDGRTSPPVTAQVTYPREAATTAGSR